MTAAAQPIDQRPDVAPKAVVLAAIVVFVARGLAYWNFLPIWDSRLYTDCLMAGAEALGHGASPLRALNCFDHPTMGYLALLVGPLKLAGYHGVLVANLLLGGLSVWGLFRICLRLAPAQAATAAGVAVIYSAHPQLLANAVSFTADHGVSVFFVLTAWALLARQFWLCALLGALLAFCKETGALLFAVVVLADAAAVIVAGEGGWAGRWRALLRRWPLALPAVVFAAFLYWKLHMAGGLWGGTTTDGIVGMMLHFRFNRVFVSYLLVMLLISFTWTLVLPILFAPVAAAVRGLGRGGPDAAAPRAQAVVFAVLLLAGAGWVLTRVDTVINPRYLFPFASALLACAFLAYVCLFKALGPRLVLIGLTAALMLASNYRLIDPLSKTAFTTFPFGDHPMLKLVSITHECCGLGRDQLQYNLEFTRFHDLTNDALQDIAATDQTWIAVSPDADWQIIGPIDPATHRRRLGADPNIGYHRLSVDAGFLASHRRGYFFAFPNIDPAPDLAELNRRFVVGAAKTYERDGYRITVYPFSVLN